MSRDNLFGDLLEIAAGNVAVANKRLSQFRDYANTVPASVQLERETDRKFSRQAERTPTQDSKTGHQGRAG